jgi:hypothetical protein
MRLLSSISLAICSLTIFGQDTTNLIHNGSFEQPGGDPPNGQFFTLQPGSPFLKGWVVGGEGVDYVKVFAKDGLWSLDLVRGPGQSGSITQVVNGLVPGLRYYLCFWLSQGDLSARAALRVSVDSLSKTIINSGTTTWELHQLSFVATDSTSHIAFAGPLSDALDAGPAVDDIKLSTNSCFPLVATIRVSEVEICWSSQQNVDYQVQYLADPTSDTWLDLLPQPVTGNGATNCVVATIGGTSKRFYRVVTVP